MNLFIETPQQAAERRARAEPGAAIALDAVRPRVFQAPPVAEPCDDGPAESAGNASADGDPAAPYSQAQSSYRDEIAYGRARDRRRKRAAALRILAFVVLMPVLLVMVFMISYAVTCILNGATPEQVVDLLRTMVARVSGFIRDLVAMA